MFFVTCLAAFASEPFELGGGLFDADSLVVGPDGTTHALVSPRKTRLSSVTNQIAFTNDQGEVIGRVGGEPVRYLRAGPGADVVVLPVPGPRGDWAEGQQVTNASLVLDGGTPVVLIAGKECDNQGCVEAAWVSHLDGNTFRTEVWARGSGIHSGLVVHASSAGGWTAVSHVSGGDGGFTGFQRFDDRGGVEPWVAAPRGSPEAIVETPTGGLGLLFRAGKTLHLWDGQTDAVVTEGVAHHADAVRAADGTVWFVAYDPERKRLRGGPVGSAASDLDLSESGWHQALTLAGGQPLAAWYYYRNNYNKGVRLGVWTGDRWDTWTQLKSETDNVGWNVDVAVGERGHTALLGLDRSDQQVVLHTWPSLEVMRAESVADAGDWTDRKRNAFFFAYGGGWYQWWDIVATPPDPDTFTYAEVEPVAGSYGIDPGLGLEGGLAGKIGPFDLALEYLRRNQDNESVQTISKLQNLVGKLGIEDLPLPDSELQLHFRASDLDGGYVAVSGEQQPFTTNERLLELRYVGKEGYHFGLRYQGFDGPLDVFESTDRTVTDRFVADGKFRTGSVVGGWAVMDYLKKYEVQFLGPYLDAQGGIGYANVALLDPDGRPGSKVSGLTFTVNGDAGLAAYRRVRSLGGLGGFARVGLRGWLQYTGNSEPEETATTTTTTGTGTEAPTAFRNFGRTDRRFGPYLHVGVVF